MRKTLKLLPRVWAEQFWINKLGYCRDFEKIPLVKLVTGLICGLLVIEQETKDSEEEEELLSDCNDWVVEQGLPEGQLLYEISDEESGAPLAILDLAWPDGLQPELSGPVALLIDEAAAVHELANDRGFRFFTTIEAFKRYVTTQILGSAQDVEVA